MWQRFTEKARKVVFYAQEEAQKAGQGYVSTEHMLLGLIRESDSLAVIVIEKLQASIAKIRSDVLAMMEHAEARPSQDMTLTPRAKRVIDLAYDEARNLNNNYIGTEHLLLGLIREGDGIAARVLDRNNVQLEQARRTVMELQDASPPNPQPPMRPLPADVHKRTLGPEVFLSFLMGGCVPQHLMLVLLADQEGLAGKAIRAQCEKPGELQWLLWEQIVSASKRGLHQPDATVLTKLLETANAEAGEDTVQPHHLLLALLSHPDLEFAEVIDGAGLTESGTREQLAILLLEDAS